MGLLKRRKLPEMNIYEQCSAGKKSFTLYNDNAIRPCCVWRGAGGYSNDINSSLKEFTNYTDEQVEQFCAKCIFQENANYESQRNCIDNDLKDALYHYDLSFSNLCNLTCRMCSSINSSKWVPLEAYLKEKTGVDWGEERDYAERNKLVKFSQSRLNDIIDHINKNSKTNTVSIEIKGGEPLIQDELKIFFDNLKYLENIKIRCFSNLTKLPDWFLEKADTVKHFNLRVSIEGVNNTYEYIRADSSFDEFVKNLDQLKYTDIHWDFAPMQFMYNIGDLHALDALILSYNKPIIDHMLFGPTYLNVKVLPPAARKILLRHVPNHYKILRAVITDGPIIHKWKKFCDYTKLLDEYHSSNFLETPTGKLLQPWIY
jgi:organic radical activating enzyme